MPDLFPTLELDAFQVMSNHVHGMIRLLEKDGVPYIPMMTLKSSSLNGLLRMRITAPQKNDSLMDQHWEMLSAK